MAALSANTCPPPGPLVLNRQHPLTRKLQLAVPVDSVYTCYDRVNGHVFAPIGTLPEYRRTRYGQAVRYYATTNSGLVNQTDATTPSNRGTVVAITSKERKNGVNIVCGMGAFGSTVFDDEWRCTTVGWNNVDVVGMNNDVQYNSSLTAPTSETPIVWRFTSSECTCFVPGVGVDTFAVNTFLTAGARGFIIGNGARGDAANDLLPRAAEGNIPLVMYWRDHQLTDGECWDLVYDPWMLFRPHRAVVAFSITDGVAPGAPLFRRSNTLQTRVGTRMPV